MARAAGALARAARLPYLTTIHATEFGRHQGWVDKHPQRHIHGVERWMARRAEGVVVCSHYMQGHVADVFGIDEAKVQSSPTASTRSTSRRWTTSPRCAAASRDPARSSCC